jgi:hypothetical protein
MPAGSEEPSAATGTHLRDRCKPPPLPLALARPCWASLTGAGGRWRALALAHLCGAGIAQEPACRVIPSSQLPARPSREGSRLSSGRPLPGP